jgi:drug/metabolite transporter (DMT)-like permease
MNKHLIIILFATIILSIAPITSKLGVLLKGSFVFSFYDLFFAALLLLIYSFIFKKKIKFSKVFIKLIILSITAYILYFYSFNYITSSTAGFINQTQLIFTLLISYLLLKEKLSNNKLLSACLVIIGGFLVYYAESMNFNNLGVLILITSNLVFAFVGYYNKKFREKYEASTIMFNNYFVGSLFMLIISLFTAPEQLFTFDEGVIYALIQGGLVDFLGWLLFINSLKYVDLSKAYLIFSFTGVITLLYSFIFFGVTIIPFQ